MSIRHHRLEYMVNGRSDRLDLITRNQLRQVWKQGQTCDRPESGRKVGLAAPRDILQRPAALIVNTLCCAGTDAVQLHKSEHGLHCRVRSDHTSFRNITFLIKLTNGSSHFRPYAFDLTKICMASGGQRVRHSFDGTGCAKISQLAMHVIRKTSVRSKQL